MTTITIDQFTEEKLDGVGVADVMMRGVLAHVTEEYSSGRIQGAEYSAVYLGALQGTQDRALKFLLEKDKVNLENEILQLEKEKLELEKLIAAANVELVEAQVNKVNAEVVLITKEQSKAEADLLRIQAQTNLYAQQAENAVLEADVLTATACKLKAEFDVLEKQVFKVDAETGLLEQRTVTEQAQTNGAVGDANSVIGRQRLLYERQADGFLRDAEQKAAKLMADTWNVRRTTEETTQADATNMLDNPNIGRAIAKLLEGIEA